MDVLAESRLALLLDRFGAVADDRQAWRLVYPLREFLAICGTMADCDDYENVITRARRTWRSCAASHPFITSCPAPTGWRR